MRKKAVHRPINGKIGMKSGALTIISIAPKSRTAWTARCVCGKEIRLRDCNVGVMRSCGCKQRERNPQKTWKGMPRLSDGSLAERSYFIQYRSQASVRNLPFNLTFTIFKSLIYGNCYYCGAAPEHTISRKDDSIIANGVDRVDNSKGYIATNCVPCCRRCNVFKGATTVQMARKICAFINKKGA